MKYCTIENIDRAYQIKQQFNFTSYCKGGKVMSLHRTFNFIMYRFYKYSIPVLVCFAASLYFNNGSTAQMVQTDVELGFNPGRVIVDKDSNNIYIVNGDENSIVVIDGTVNEVKKSINVIDTPAMIGIDNVINNIYVTHPSSKSISVIDSLENRVIKVIQLEKELAGISVNSEMNLLYVVQRSFDFSDTLLVIEGDNHEIINTIDLGMQVVDIAFNEVTGLIYVLSDSDSDFEIPFDNIVTVIDSSTNKILSKFVGGTTREPSIDIDINPETNMIYVVTTGVAVKTIEVFDGRDNENIGTIDFAENPDIGDITKITVNSTTNQIYLIDNQAVDNDGICLIDGDFFQIIDCINNLGQELFDLAVNSENNNVYVTDKGNGRLVVFSDEPIIPPPKGDCETEVIAAIDNKIILQKGKKRDINIKLTGADGCPAENVKVEAKINLRGKRVITLSPSTELSDSVGIATFSVTAKRNYGNAIVTFSANELKELVNVNIAR